MLKIEFCDHCSSVNTIASSYLFIVDWRHSTLSLTSIGIVYYELWAMPMAYAMAMPSRRARPRLGLWHHVYDYVICPCISFWLRIHFAMACRHAQAEPDLGQGRLGTGPGAPTKKNGASLLRPPTPLPPNHHNILSSYGQNHILRPTLTRGRI